MTKASSLLLSRFGRVLQVPTGPAAVDGADSHPRSATGSVPAWAHGLPQRGPRRCPGCSAPPWDRLGDVPGVSAGRSPVRPGISSVAYSGGLPRPVVPSASPASTGSQFVRRVDQLAAAPGTWTPCTANTRSCRAGSTRTWVPAPPEKVKREGGRAVPVTGPSSAAMPLLVSLGPPFGEALKPAEKHPSNILAKGSPLSPTRARAP